jgi:hypothetical protein
MAGSGCRGPRHSTRAWLALVDTLGTSVVRWHARNCSGRRPDESTRTRHSRYPTKQAPAFTSAMH